jgi:hypothetical protein
VHTTTDASGHYEVTFLAVPGAYLEGSTAEVDSLGGGYENEFRFLRLANADAHQTLDLHPRLITQITAGDSTGVTVVPTDTLCVDGLQDLVDSAGIDFVCRTVRILVPADGALTVELQSVSGISKSLLETEYLTTGAEACASPALDNPRTVGARAGTVFLAHVEMDAFSTVSQTFTLKTSLVPSPQGCGSSSLSRRNR